MVPKEDYVGNPLENGGLYADQGRPIIFCRWHPATVLWAIFWLATAIFYLLGKANFYHPIISACQDHWIYIVCFIFGAGLGGVWRGKYEEFQKYIDLYKSNGGDRVYSRHLFLKLRKRKLIVFFVLNRLINLFGWCLFPVSGLVGMVFTRWLYLELSMEGWIVPFFMLGCFNFLAMIGAVCFLRYLAVNRGALRKLKPLALIMDMAAEAEYASLLHHPKKFN